MVSSAKADQNSIRQHNASLALRELWRFAPLARADLAKRLGLNRSTVSAIVARLLVEELVVETQYRSDRIGRPGLLLEFNARGSSAVGVEIGGESVHVALIDLAGQMVWRRRILVGAGEEQGTFVHIAEEMIRQAMAAARDADVHVFGIGLALPGLVDARNGELRYSPSLRWRSVPFGTQWRERFGMPVFVENNANAGAMGEYYFGVARDVADFIYIGGAPGIGGGIFMDGALVHGRGGFAGEIGHMTVASDGELCTCGKRGCWETVVGPQAVIADYRRRAAQFNGGTQPDMHAIGLRDMVEAARLPDVAAGAALHQAAEYLGAGIANLVNVFNPEMVVLGGALGEIGEALIPVAVETVKKQSLFPMRDSLSILSSSHGVDDCVMGAVALVLDHVLREPIP